jgi:hypothetical protein
LKFYARQFCRRHYQRFKKYGDPVAQIRRKNKRGTCFLLECFNPHYAFGYCNLHYNRIRDGVDIDLPKRKWTRATKFEEVDWYLSNDGYVVGYLNGRPIRQHRLIWELHHGRKLQRFENIHHKNGIRTDNRIENLELWTKPQPYGQRPEDLVDWVLEHYRELIIEKLEGSRP